MKSIRYQDGKVCKNHLCSGKLIDFCQKNNVFRQQQSFYGILVNVAIAISMLKGSLLPLEGERQINNGPKCFER